MRQRRSNAPATAGSETPANTGETPATRAAMPATRGGSDATGPLYIGARRCPVPFEMFPMSGWTRDIAACLESHELDAGCRARLFVALELFATLIEGLEPR